MARPRGFEEEQVVMAAMEVFWQHGYQGTSVQALVDATGLQRGSLYGAFTDKHGLFMASLDAYADMAVARVRDLVAAEKDPVEGLRAFVRERGWQSEDAGWASRGCLVGNTCSELVAHDEQARARVEAFVVAMQRVMADALRGGQALGTFSTDRDADAVATFLQASLQGLTLLAKTAPAAEVTRGVVAEILRVLD